MAVNKYIGKWVYRWRKSIRPAAGFNGLCYLCRRPLGVEESYLCDPCTFDLPVIANPCTVCAMPTAAGELCADCIQDDQPVIDTSYCPYRYAYPANKLIQEMKFNSRLDLAAFFAQSLIDCLYASYAEIPQCLMPVPLHTSRLRQRGYNQSLGLAVHLSQRLNIPVIQGVSRTKKTRIQSELPADQRKNNVRDAFSVNRTTLPACDHIAIVDDVITTGATVREIARLVKDCGYNRVDVWACARAVI